MSLTMKKVAKLLRQGVPGRHIDSDSGDPERQRGLYLVVHHRDSASYELRYQLHGSPHWMGIGSARTFSLPEARERARAARQQLADKVDPLEAKRTERAAAKLAKTAKKKVLTFRAAAQRYFTQNQSKWTNAAHSREFLRSLERYAFPHIGDMDVAAIKLADVLSVLEPHWTTKCITVDRVRRRVEAVLDWCVVREYRPPGTNPAQWKGHLDQVLPAPRKIAPVQNFKALDYHDLPAFMATLREDDSTTGRGLQFLIHTAARYAEVTGAKWGEIDIEEATWTIPPNRMKSKRIHRVPLSPQALDLLAQHYDGKPDAFVFIGPAGGSLSHMALSRVMARLGYKATVHGFRSSFRTWAAEQTNYPREICERALAHVTGSRTEVAYERSDQIVKRRKLMETWSKYCSTPPVAGKVLTLRGVKLDAPLITQTKGT
jgi:integrase